MQYGSDTHLHYERDNYPDLGQFAQIHHMKWPKALVVMTSIMSEWFTCDHLYFQLIWELQASELARIPRQWHAFGTIPRSSVLVENNRDRFWGYFESKIQHMTYWMKLEIRGMQQVKS